MAIVLGTTAATETERDVGTSAFTSSMVTMTDMTAKANALIRVQNATSSVPPPSAAPLQLSVARVLKQNVSPREICSLKEESELAKRTANVSITLKLVDLTVRMDTSIVEESVAMHLNTGSATGSVWKIMCNATGFVLMEEKCVEKSSVSHQTLRTLTPQPTTRSAMASVRR